MTEPTESIKLTAVRVSSIAPEQEVPLSDYSLKLVRDLPYFHFLYGNRTAYMALGEILKTAQNENKYFSSASLSIEVCGFKRIGVLHWDDLNSNLRGVVNLSRVSKEIIQKIAELYQKDRVKRRELEELTSSDWRKPFRFMPDQLHLLPDVFDLLGCEILVHPARLLSTPLGAHHFIASVRMDKVKIIEVEPNLFEPGPHPERILL